MRILIAVLFSALLIQLTGHSPVNNLEPKAAQPVLAGQRQQATLTVKTVVKDETPVAQVPEVQPEQVQGCAAYRSLLQQYDWDINVMAAVMQAESNCNPNAASPPNYDGLRDYGLMQLHGQEIFDPATNIAHAYAIWQRQGYGAWTTYNDGAFYAYL